MLPILPGHREDKVLGAIPNLATKGVVGTSLVTYFLAKRKILQTNFLKLAGKGLNDLYRNFDPLCLPQVRQ